MKTKEELNALKEEVEELNKKLAELTEEELAQVSGGVAPVIIGLPGIEPPAPYDSGADAPRLYRPGGH